MRKIILFIFVVSQVLAMGVAYALANDLGEIEASIAEVFMAQHISAVCATDVPSRDVLYIGENDDHTWFYTNVYYNDATKRCTVLTRDSQVWSYPTNAINK